MPLIEESLYSVLSGHAALAALVDTRISPAQSIPAGTRPCVTMHQVTGNFNYTQDGVDANVEDWWQFNAWAMTYDAMRAVASAIVAALHAAPAASFYAFIDQRQDLYENDTRVHHGIVVARIWWKAVEGSGKTMDDVLNMDDVTDMDTLEEVA